MNLQLKRARWVLNRLNSERPQIGDTMVLFQNMVNNQKITNTSQGKAIVPRKGVQRRLTHFWTSTLEA